MNKSLDTSDMVIHLPQVFSNQRANEEVLQKSLSYNKKFMDYSGQTGVSNQPIFDYPTSSATIISHNSKSLISNLNKCNFSMNTLGSMLNSNDSAIFSKPKIKVPAVHKISLHNSELQNNDANISKGFLPVVRNHKIDRTVAKNDSKRKSKGSLK